MKLTFISNFHNHHQIPLCDEWMANPNIEFTFIATEKVPEERIQMGYQTEFAKYPYYKEISDDFTREDAEQLCYYSDVVIIGSAPDSYVKRRLKENKLTFLYSERFFKDGFWKHPGDVWRAFKRTTANRFKSFYILCASAYTASDAHKVLFGQKTLKWGYFPQTRRYELEELRERKESATIRLLWVGRLLEWKHPDMFLAVCKKMREKGISFQAEMIGAGELKDMVANFVTDYQLEDCIRLYSSMSPEEVRTHMEHADIFLFTSDYREGWGAVLNEAMNSGCVCIACKEAGATGFLIRDKKNGFVYEESNDQATVFDILEQIVEQRKDAQSIGMNAYHTICDLWNAKVAAERLYEFSSAYLGERELPKYDEGPMSKA